ncbi:hypothetical protein L3Q82_015458 [Scortum barcoo]|uniref:Uncharacterized protein n=1 Tax=Scortum barcoo TaxID=214431 RepID=A0ACB8VN63_9TELE|nr:hypothetical protein L3Q82_015458 [Scortum barcoo]
MWWSAALWETPQGTVLSPFLFPLYTSDFTYSTDSFHQQNFSDYIAIVGCVSEGNDCEYRKVIMDFVDWCELNHLQVNASKTKEMVIDFSRKPSSEIAPVNIQGLDIERVRTYKYLGVHLNATVVAVTAFLDAFQKVADLATNSRGGTRDIGSALTRMCMRHRSIEAKLKQFSISILHFPSQPEYKRAWQEIKKSSSDTLKLQKQANKALRLTHLQLPNTYVRMLFVDISSASNTVITDKLIAVPLDQRLPHQQASGDDTTIVGLISDNDETHYREEIQHLTQWCSNNNLVLNTSKTKEVIVDYRRSRRTEHAPLLIHGEAVERVNNIKFLGIHITSDLTWSMNTAHLVKKAQQRLFFLRKLKRAGLSPQLLTNFYRATIESILCLSAAVWYGSCTRLKGLSPGGENSTGDCEKSSSRPGLNIRWPDPEEGPTYCHPGNGLFVPLPSGKRYRNTKDNN